MAPILAKIIAILIYPKNTMLEPKERKFYLIFKIKIKNFKIQKIKIFSFSFCFILINFFIFSSKTVYNSFQNIYRNFYLNLYFFK
jgi:hypothetical protein